MNIFKRFNDVGVTVLIATHDVHLIDRYAVRRVILSQGRALDGGEAPVQPVESITATAGPATPAAAVGTAAPTRPLVLPDIKLD